MSKYHQLLYEMVLKDDLHTIKMKCEEYQLTSTVARIETLEEGVGSLFKSLGKKLNKPFNARISPIVKRIKDKLSKIEKETVKSAPPLNTKDFSKERMNKVRQYTKSIEAMNNNKLKGIAAITKVMKELDEELQLFDDEVAAYKDYIDKVHRHMIDIDHINTERWKDQLDRGNIDRSEYEEYTKLILMPEY